jgi:ubiquinone/menaquinone biosynthesis C-methylase UbiE
MTDEGGWAAAANVRSAERWRSATESWGSAMTEALLDSADLRPNSCVLDVAAGSGDPALYIAGRLREGSVVAVDNSYSSLLLAKRQADEMHLESRFKAVGADALDFPFTDCCFDRVTCRCGIMFFADVDRALKETWRVLKQGGRAAFLAWGPWEQPFFESTVGTILRLVPGTSIPETARAMFRFAASGTIVERLRAAGFRNAKQHDRTLPRVWVGSAQQLWQYVQEISVPFHPLLRAIPSNKRAEVDAAVCRELARFQNGSTITTPARVVLATAER